MDTCDRELLDHLSELAHALVGGALAHLRRERDPDRFAKNLRDLGQEFADLGAILLTRSADLNVEPPPDRWHHHT
jgi:hypothetical protein